MVGHAHSISLSLCVCVCLDLPRSFSDKNDISPCLSPIRPIHIVYSLTHIVYLGQSLQPSHSFDRTATLCDRLTLIPPTHKIYLHVCDWIISQALSYSPHPCQKLNRTISLQSIYIYSMNVGPHSLCLSIYMSLDWPRFLTPYLPRVEATTSPSLTKPELFTLRGALQPWINLCRHLFRSV